MYNDYLMHFSKQIHKMERQIFHQTDIRDQWVINIINKYKAIKSHNAKCALTLAIIKNILV